ncbi:MAG: LysR family transcriptional regulator [Proteobacteria bacterium]|nr:LysR family transcriptional regulator [Pseudomonadota bacterium]
MERPPFRLHHVALLHVVLNARTLTEAARRLNVSQPAVSKQIKQLQADLGFALFERDGHRLVPTFEARTMLEQFGRVNASLDVLNRLAGELRVARRGHLQVAAIHTVALNLLPSALQAAIGKDRHLLCTVHTGNTAQVLEWVETQQVDLAVAMKVRDTSRLRYTPLMPVRLECVMPRSHPLARRRKLSSEDLADQPLIGIELPAMVWTGSDATSWDEGLGAMRMRVDSAQVAYAMVEAGLGLAVLDSLTASAATQRGALVRRALDRPQAGELGLYRPAFRPGAAAAEGLAAALHKQVGHGSNA